MGKRLRFGVWGGGKMEGPPFSNRILPPPILASPGFSAQELRSCVKVEVVVWGFQSLTVLMVSVDVSSIDNGQLQLRSCVKVEVVVLRLPISISPYGFCGRQQL